MAMPRKQLDLALERWAQWVHRGGVLPSAASVMEVMIANKGVMCFGSGGKKTVGVDCIEAEIEAEIMKMANSNKPKLATVLRVEFGVNHRIAVAANESQLKKALALDLSLQTYRIFGHCRPIAII
ncbi:hypothetical protein [Photobacterium leiognathi]|uniref:hypothetical protein n=1 Tax=Photobacterium leiognathi TaxID=553611 RepID=UPI0027391157|nr:hypothetical protein [Photobacterium leiognathi]